jgi:hypothetical protein
VAVTEEAEKVAAARAARAAAATAREEAKAAAVGTVEAAVETRSNRGGREVGVG